MRSDAPRPVDNRDWSDEDLAALRAFTVRVARSSGLRDSADDIAHEALIELWRAKSTVQHPRAWLWTVVRRRVARYLNRRHRYLPMPDLESLLPPQSARRQTEVHILVSEVFSELSTRDRRILTLQLNGASYSEIAAAVGCREAAVGRLVHRARKRARKILDS